MINDDSSDARKTIRLATSSAGPIRYFGFDPITWVVEHRPDPTQGEYPDPEQGVIGFMEVRRVSTDNWRIHMEDIPDQEYSRCWRHL